MEIAGVVSLNSESFITSRSAFELFLLDVTVNQWNLGNYHRAGVSYTFEIVQL